MTLLFKNILQQSRSMFFALILPAGAFLFSSLNAQAQAIEYVVFSIEGAIEGITLGQVLHEGNHFEVPENTSVSLISKQGEVITLKGPVKATVTLEVDDKKAEQTLASISDQLFTGGKFVASVGGTRSSAGETDVKKIVSVQAGQKPWVPLLSEANTYCVRSENFVMRRQSAQDDLLLQLDDKSIIWDAGQHEINLKRHLIDADGQSTFYLSVENTKKQIFIFSGTQSSVAEEVAWLAGKGCENQAIMLLANNIKS